MHLLLRSPESTGPVLSIAGRLGRRGGVTAAGGRVAALEATSTAARGLVTTTAGSRRGAVGDVAETATTRRLVAATGGGGLATLGGTAAAGTLTPARGARATAGTLTTAKSRGNIASAAGSLLSVSGSGRSSSGSSSGSSGGGLGRRKLTSSLHGLTLTPGRPGTSKIELRTATLRGTSGCSREATGGLCSLAALLGFGFALALLLSDFVKFPGIMVSIKL